MFRLLICHRRKSFAGSSRAYWLGPRARLIRGLQPALQYLRYSQVHQLGRLNPLYLGILASRSWLPTRLIATIQRRPLPPSLAQGPPSEKWDIVEEFWFESEEMLEQALSSVTGRAAFERMATELNGKVSRSGLMLANALTIADAPHLPSGSIATLFFLGRTSDLTREQMLHHWETSHAKLVLSLQRSLNFHAYDQLHARRVPKLEGIANVFRARVVEYDGVADLMYSSQGVVGRGFLNPLTQLANFKLVGDEIHFIDGNHSVLVFGKRYVQ